jgi:hypothetical protein
MNKFKAGDIVRLLPVGQRTGQRGYAADPGARARVESQASRKEIFVRWEGEFDKSSRNGQRDGTYYADDFELVEPEKPLDFDNPISVRRPR